MELNSKILKISGKVELPEHQEIEMDKEIVIVCKGSVVKIEEGSRQDGTVDRTYKVKLVDAIIEPESLKK